MIVLDVDDGDGNNDGDDDDGNMRMGCIPQMKVAKVVE